MVRVLVIGGFGFIGRHLCLELTKLGYLVRVFGHHSRNAEIQNKGSAEYVFGDFTNVVDLEIALEEVDVVYHLVGNSLPASSNLNPRFDIDSHVGPTLSLLDLCVKKRVKKVIFTSSGGTVYGIPNSIPIREDHPLNPLNSYGIQKMTIEHYLRLYSYLHGLKGSVLRVSNPYGIGQNVAKKQGLIATILHQSIIREKIEVWGDGSTVRDYIYIDDLVSAMGLAVKSDDDFEIFNVGSGQGASITEIIEMVERVTKQKLDICYMEGRKSDVPINVLDIDKFCKRFDWSPKFSLESGIRDFESTMRQDAK